MPADEQYEVLEALRQRSREREERDGPLQGAALEAHDAEFWSLMREVREEEKRTGITVPGWIVIGKGHTVHRLVRKVSPDMLRDVSRAQDVLRRRQDKQSS